MRKQAARSLAVLAVIGTLIYPVVVYFGISFLPPAVFVVLGAILVSFRVAGAKNLPKPSWLIGVAGILVLSTAYFVAPLLAVKIYPVLLSLGVALIFAGSLFFPPPVVERIARLSEPDLPEAAVKYTRIVTEVWVVVLIFNAGVSLAAALWGTMQQWTLWNGLLSYVLLGAVFGAEWLMRKRFRDRLMRMGAEPPA